MDKGGCCWQSKPGLLPEESAGVDGTVRHTCIHAMCLQCAFTAAGACHPAMGEVHGFDIHTYICMLSHIHKERQRCVTRVTFQER